MIKTWTKVNKTNTFNSLKGISSLHCLLLWNPRNWKGKKDFSSQKLLINKISFFFVNEKEFFFALFMFSLKSFLFSLLEMRKITNFAGIMSPSSQRTWVTFMFCFLSADFHFIYQENKSFIQITSCYKAKSLVPCHSREA